MHRQEQEAKDEVKRVRKELEGQMQEVQRMELSGNPQQVSDE